jgi:hypothetical protein
VSETGETTDATDVVLSYAPEPQGSIDLTQEWVAWLQSSEVPANVTGVDPALDDLGGSDPGYA